MRKLILSLILIVFSTIASAATYHVATTGDDGTDGHDGTTLGKAWLTMPYALAHISGGDTLYIHEGTYTLAAATNSDSTVPSGTDDDNRTIISGVDGEAMPVIDAGMAADYDSESESGRYVPFYLAGKSYITFNRIHATNGCGHTRGNWTIGDSTAGGGSHHITVQYCKSSSISRGHATDWHHNNPAAIWIGRGDTYNITIDHCELYGDSVGEGSGIKIQTSNNVTVQYCSFHHLLHGIANKWGNADNYGLIFQYNYFNYMGIGDVGNTDDGQGSIWVSTPGTQIKHNLIVNHDLAPGISIANYETYDAGTSPVIMNNTVYGCGDAGIYLHTVSGSSVSDATVQNNVVVNCSGSHGKAFSVNCYGSGLPATSDYNLFYNSSSTQNINSPGECAARTLAQWQNDSSLDAHSTSTEPTFANGTGNMNTIVDFEITGGGGNNAGSDSKDMGADVSLVGPNASGSGTPAPPTLSNVTISNGRVQ